MYELDFTYLLEHAPELGRGLGWTIMLSVLAIAASGLVGIVFGAVRSYRVPLVNQVVIGFVEFIRNTPLLVQIFFLFFAFPLVGISFSAFVTAFVTLTVWGAAYNTENFRAGFDAVNRETSEAGLALGLRQHQVFRYLVLPLGFHVAFRSVLNTSISVLKNSSYMVVISFPELTETAVNLATRSFRVFELFGLLGAVYLGLVGLLSYVARRLESRLMTPYETAATTEDLASTRMDDRPLEGSDPSKGTKAPVAEEERP